MDSGSTVLERGELKIIGKLIRDEDENGGLSVKRGVVGLTRKFLYLL